MYQSKKDSNQPVQKTDHLRKLIRIKAVIELTGLSKSYIYDLSSRDLFPKKISLVPGGTSVAWVATEIQAWIESRIQQRDEVLNNE